MILIKRALTLIELVISIVIMSMLIFILSSVVAQVVYINNLMETKTIAFDNLSTSIDFFETQIRTHEIIEPNTNRLLGVNSSNNEKHYFLYSTNKNGSICFGDVSNYLSQNIKKVDITYSQNKVMTIHIQADIHNNIYDITRQIYVNDKIFK